MTKKGKLIVLEGGDGSGKGTQLKLLQKYFQGKDVSFFDFPQYEKSFFGKLIGRCLTGEMGDFVGLSPYLACLPFLLDQASAKEEIKAALEVGDVICDRYTTSSVAFQSAKSPKEKQQEVQRFIEQAAYEEMEIPAPDLVIYLDVPVEIAGELVMKKERRAYLNGTAGKDLHEKDTSFLEKVALVYRDLAEERENWKTLICLDENGELKKPETIHQEILDILEVLKSPHDLAERTEKQSDLSY
ncbi:MAG TPA: hypothetical protein VFM02_00785 [Candidatus Paceibacterota bacterium]|nr:hypothetical protein [Candidatus Paceibacterota bacterium]